MDKSPVTSPTHTTECPLLVVTGPTSLVSSSSLSNKRLSDTAQQRASPGYHDDHVYLASPEMTSHDTEFGALSDGELDRRATPNRRLQRTRFTVHSQVQRPSVVSTDSVISRTDATHLRVADRQRINKFGTLPRKRTESKRPTRRISCKDLGSGQCKGWLMKKREALKSKSWVKRWCVLSSRSLYYYKTEEDVKAQGVIYLPGFKISPAPEIKTKKFAFKAHHSGTTFYFAAERQDDMAKWMNKLGLASLDELELSEATLTAGFWKPPEMLPQVKSASHQDLSRLESKSPQYYCSESDDSLSRNESPNTSRDDITALYRNLERADLDIAGSNVKDRRSTMLLSIFSDDSHGRDDTWRHLLSLNRTLKDREQTLAAIETLLLQDPIRSEHLSDFMVQHPDVVEQPANMDDAPQDSDVPHRAIEQLPETADSEQLSDSILCDTSRHSSHVVSSTTVTCRHQSDSAVCLSSKSLSVPSDKTGHKPRRPSQETTV